MDPSCFVLCYAECLFFFSRSARAVFLLPAARCRPCSACCAMWGSGFTGNRPALPWLMSTPATSLSSLPLPRGLSVGSWYGGPVLRWSLPARPMAALPSSRVVNAWVGSDERPAKAPRSAPPASSPLSLAIIDKLALDDFEVRRRGQRQEAVTPKTDL